MRGVKKPENDQRSSYNLIQWIPSVVAAMTSQDSRLGLSVKARALSRTILAFKGGIIGASPSYTCWLQIGKLLEIVW